MSIKQLLCPRDHSNLISQSYESIVQVDYCLQCSGIWLDKGELEKIEDSSVNDYPEELALKDDPGEDGYEMAAEEAKPSITCPKCKIGMEKSEYGYCSSVLVNSCPHCGGMWLDHGELKAIVVFFERQKLRSSPLISKFWQAIIRLVEPQRETKQN